ncbi:kinase-like protein [Delitschia confertaspora ATCC 74209]|uniref:Kinase-like protein n=1 Tax=Delitschia confertaspora ATCC 74209 TaxID=1513339 RepID=A0A9P4JCE1_9PLEO|nr:kinase-like protein [Delitschia confertaspora ATCC 74209]
MGLFGNSTKNKKELPKPSKRPLRVEHNSLPKQLTLQPRTVKPSFTVPDLQTTDTSKAALSRPNNVPSAPQNTPVPTEIAQETPEEVVWKDWSGRGQHAEFQMDEQLPLKQGDVLGHGRNGFVCKTSCKGVVVAWKQYGPDVEPDTLKEKNILIRLNHPHIVKLVGTYKHHKPTGGVEVGLLTWPVAVCDLSVFLGDVDSLTELKDKTAAAAGSLLDPRRKQRLEFIGFDWSNPTSGTKKIQMRMLQSIGCLAGAMAYLHSQDVRHKDLKPANILLYPVGIRLTDFGNSTDFSQLNASATDNGGARGSPRYFAPEAASWDRTGRSADIFSLGCVFLEMIHSASESSSLQKLEQLRPLADSSGRSYQVNLSNLPSWTYIDGASCLTNYLLCEIRTMLARDANARPRATDLVKSFSHMSHLDPSETDALHGACCSSLLKEKEKSNIELERFHRNSTKWLSQNHHMEREIKALKEKIDEHVKTITAYEGAIRDLKDDANRKKDVSVDLNNKLAAQKILNAGLQGRVGQLEKDIEDRQGHVEKLENTLTAYMKTSTDNSRLRKEITHRDDEVLRSRKETAALLAEQHMIRTRLEKDAQVAENRMVDLERQLETQTNQVQRLRDHMESTEGKLAKAEYESNRLGIELKNAREDIELAHQHHQEVYGHFESIRHAFSRYDEQFRNRKVEPRRRLIEVARSDSGYETGAPHGNTSSNTIHTNPSPLAHVSKKKGS